MGGMDTPDHDEAVTALVRRRWSADEKRAIVEEGTAPGNSVPAVAARHNVSASQVYRWVRQFRQESAPQSETALLPVTVAETNRGRRVERSAAAIVGERPGSLELAVGNAHLSVHGAADLCSLRLVLQYLLG